MEQVILFKIKLLKQDNLNVNVKSVIQRLRQARVIKQDSDVFDLSIPVVYERERSYMLDFSQYKCASFHEGGGYITNPKGAYYWFVPEECCRRFVPAIENRVKWIK